MNNRIKPGNIYLIAVLLIVFLHPTLAISQNTKLKPSSPPAKAPYYVIDKVAEMVKQVSERKLHRTVLDLQLNSLHMTRYTLHDNAINNAANYIEDKFESYGLDAWQEYYDFGGSYGVPYYPDRPNVIAEIQGSVYPDKIYVLCAHFDSINGAGKIPSMFNAPGANDNASGTAGVLECARIMASSGVDFKSTVRFICFSGEEQIYFRPQGLPWGGGLWGSYFYVEKHIDDDFQGVLNLDMVGYQGSGDVQLLYHAEYSKWLAEQAGAAIDKYFSWLPYQIIKHQPGVMASDHYCFHKEGFSAIFLTEDHDKEYIWWHTTDDTIDKLTFSMLANCTKVALATIAIEAMDDIYSHDWLFPTGYIDPDNEWHDEHCAYDNDVGTKAFTSVDWWANWKWTPWIEVTLSEARNCDALGFYAWRDEDYCKEIDIDVYHQGFWHNVYEGEDFLDRDWTYKSIPNGSLSITKARVRFWAKGTLLGNIEADLHEFKLREKMPED